MFFVFTKVFLSSPLTRVGKWYCCLYSFRAGEEYAAGRMLTGEVKKILIGILTQMTKDHQDARAAVTDEMVRNFMAVRPIDGSGGAGAGAGSPVPPPPGA